MSVNRAYQTAKIEQTSVSKTVQNSKGSLLGRACYCVAVPAKIAALVGNPTAVMSISGLGYATTSALSKTLIAIGKIATLMSDPDLVEGVLAVASDISKDTIKLAKESGETVTNIASLIPIVSNVTSGAKIIHDANLRTTEGIVQYTYRALTEILPSICKIIGRAAGYTGTGLGKVSSQLKFSMLNPSYVSNILQNIADRSASVAFKMMYIGQEIRDVERKLVTDLDVSKIEVSQDELIELCSVPYEQLQDRIDGIASAKSLQVTWSEYRRLLTVAERIKSKCIVQYETITTLYFEIEELELELNKLIEEDSIQRQVFEKKLEQKKELLHTCAQTIIDVLEGNEKEQLIKLIQLHKAKHECDVAITYNDYIKTFSFEKQLHLLKFVREHAKGIHHVQRKNLEKLEFIDNEKEWIYHFPDKQIREKCIRSALISFNKLSEKTKAKIHDITLSQLEIIQNKDRVQLFQLAYESITAAIKEKEEKIKEYSDTLRRSSESSIIFPLASLDEETESGLQTKVELFKKEREYLEIGLQKLKNLQYEFVDLEEDPLARDEKVLQKKKELLQTQDDLRVFQTILNQYVPTHAKYLIKETLEEALSLFIFGNEKDIENAIREVKEKIRETRDSVEKEQLYSYLEGLEKAYDLQKETYIEALYDEKENSVTLAKDGVPVYKAPLNELSIEIIQQKIGSNVVSQGIWLTAGKGLGLTGGAITQGAAYIPWGLFSLFGYISSPSGIKYASSTVSFVIPFLSSFMTPLTAKFLENIGVPVRSIENMGIQLTKAVAGFSTTTLHNFIDTTDKILLDINTIVDSKGFDKALVVAQENVEAATQSAVTSLMNYCWRQDGIDEICEEFKKYSFKDLIGKMQDAIRESQDEKNFKSIIALMTPKKGASDWKELFLSIFSKSDELQQLSAMASDSSIQQGISDVANKMAQVSYLQQQMSQTAQTIHILEAYSSILGSAFDSLRDDKVASIKGLTVEMQRWVSWAKNKIGFISKAQTVQALSLDLAYLPGQVQDMVGELGEKGQNAIKTAEEYLGGETGLSATTKLFLGYGLPFLSAAFLSGSGGFVILPYLLRTVAPKLIKSSGIYFADRIRPFWYELAQSSLDTFKQASVQVEELGISAGSAIQSLLNKGGFVDPLRIKNFKELPFEAQCHLIELAIHSDYIEDIGSCDNLKGLYENFKNKTIALEGQHDFIRDVLLIFDHLHPYELTGVSESYYNLLDRNIQLRIRNLVKRECGLKKKDFSNVERIVRLFNSLPIEKKKQVNIIPVYEFHKLDIDAQRDIKFMIVHSKEYQDFLKREGREVPLSFDEIYIELRKSKSWNNHRLNQLLPIYAQLQEIEAKKCVLTPMRIHSMSVERILHAISLVERYGLHKVGILFTPDKIKLLRDILGEEKNENSLSIAQRKAKSEYIELLASAFQQLKVYQQQYFLNISETEIIEMDSTQLSELALYLLSLSSLQKDEELKNILLEINKAEKPLTYELRETLLQKFNALPLEQQAEYQSHLQFGLRENDMLIDVYTEELRGIDIAIKIAIKEQHKVIHAIKRLKDGIEAAQAEKKVLIDQHTQPLPIEISKRIDELDEKILAFTTAYETKVKIADNYGHILSEKRTTRKYFATVLEGEGAAIPPEPSQENGYQFTQIELDAFDLTQKCLFKALETLIKHKLTIPDLEREYAHAKEVITAMIYDTRKKIEGLKKNFNNLDQSSDSGKKYELIYLKNKQLPLYEFLLKKHEEIFPELEKVYMDKKKQIESVLLVLPESLRKNEEEFSVACRSFVELKERLYVMEKRSLLLAAVRQKLGDTDKYIQNQIAIGEQELEKLLAEMSEIKERILQLESRLRADQENSKQISLSESVKKTLEELSSLFTIEQMTVFSTNNRELDRLIEFFQTKISVVTTSKALEDIYRYHKESADNKLLELKQKYALLYQNMQNSEIDYSELADIINEYELWTQYDHSIDELVSFKSDLLQKLVAPQSGIVDSLMNEDHGYPPSAKRAKTGSNHIRQPIFNQASVLAPANHINLHEDKQSAELEPQPQSINNTLNNTDGNPPDSNYQLQVKMQVIKNLRFKASGFVGRIFSRIRAGFKGFGAWISRIFRRNKTDI